MTGCAEHGVGELRRLRGHPVGRSELDLKVHKGKGPPARGGGREEAQRARPPAGDGRGRPLRGREDLQQRPTGTAGRWSSEWLPVTSWVW